MRVKLGGEGCLDFRIRSHASPTLPPYRGLLEIVHLGQTLQPNLRLFWLSRVNHELGRKPCSRSKNSYHRKLQRRGVHWSNIKCSSHNFSSIPGDEDGMSSAGQEPSRVCSDEASASSKALSKTTGKQSFMRVPWRGAVIWQVMMLWTFAYVIHPQWIIPLGLELVAGLDRAQLSSRGEALLHVALDLGMLGFTIGILWLCLKRYRPRALGWFRGRVWPPKWLLKVLVACGIGFPIAMYLGDFSQLLVPTTDAEVWNYLHLEETLAAGDKITNLMYFLVLTVCAPLWEEMIFRGFLMPSLTKYMPPWSAVGLTALIFACVHFSCQRFLPLLVLGIVFGGLYAESRNLLAAITAHSLWNMCVFAQVLIDSPPGARLAF